MKMESQSLPSIQVLKTDTLEMEYFTFGSGPKPFVILPGLSLKPVMLAAEAVAASYKEFTQDYTVYLFDPPKDLQPGYTISQLAEDTAAAFRHLGISKACVLGCSMGGMRAQYIAARHPELVDKMVLASTAARIAPASCGVLDSWYALAKAGDVRKLNREVNSRVYSPAFFEKFRDSFEAREGDGTPEEMRQFSILVSAIRNVHVYDELDQVQCPALVIGSREDQVLSGEASAEIAEKLHCSLHLYSDFGHAVYDEAPDFHPRILKFFSES